MYEMKCLTSLSLMRGISRRICAIGSLGFKTGAKPWEEIGSDRPELRASEGEAMEG